MKTIYKIMIAFLAISLMIGIASADTFTLCFPESGANNFISNLSNHPTLLCIRLPC